MPKNTYPGAISRSRFPFLLLSGLYVLDTSVQFAPSLDIYLLAVWLRLPTPNPNSSFEYNSVFCCSTTPKLRKGNIFHSRYVGVARKREGTLPFELLCAVF